MLREAGRRCCVSQGPVSQSSKTAYAQVPNKEQVLALSEELRSRSALPAHVPAVLKALPPGTHPMTQFSTAVLALQARRALNLTLSLNQL